MRSARSIFTEKVGKLNPLQERTFEIINKGTNCLIMAPTGSGKTEAAILPILEKIVEQKTPGVAAIYVTPLRALNRDLMLRLEQLCKDLGIEIGVRHGDTSTTERQKQAAHPPQLIITTPESIQAMLLSPRLRAAFANLKFVIVDELHELYYNKRGAQLSVALERLEALSGRFTRVGISATIGSIDEAADFLFHGMEHEIVNSEVEKKLEITVVMPDLPQRRHPEFEAAFDLDPHSLARIEYITDMIKQSKATLVFANTRQVVEALGSKILYLSRLEGFDYVGIHHSSLDRDERIDIENKFKQGTLNCIIATSSLELGIDIGRIETVIQYGSPRQANRLLQRVGRSGHREGAISKGHVVVSGALEALEAVSATISAKEKKLEPKRIDRNALDVLANQLSSIALQYREIDTDKVYSMITKSAVYSSLSRVDFDKVADFCSELGIIKKEKSKIFSGRRTRTYFIENISVIPDTKRYFVKRASTNKLISTLDEYFVYNSIDENASFITKGLPWKVVGIEEDTIFVEPADNLEASIPDWEGEDIPVAYEIASKTMALLLNPAAAEKIAEPDSLKQIIKFCENQAKFFVPNLDSVFVEELDDYTVLYTPLGKLANEFMAKTIAYLLRKSGSDVYARATPYAVIIELRSATKKPDMQKLFNLMQGVKSDAMISEVLSNSELFRHKFAQIAKTFGIVEKKAVITRGTLTKLMEFYKETPIHEETIRDLKKNYIDSAVISSFISKIINTKDSIKYAPHGSPLSKEVLLAAFGYKELISTDIQEADVQELKYKIGKKPIQMLCTYCSFMFSREIDTADMTKAKIICPRCASPMVSSYKEEYYHAVSKKLQTKRLHGTDAEVYQTAIKEAGLIEAYGDRALASMLTYGVGLSTAGRVLKNMRKSDKSFIEDLLYAQKLFIKNSKFWKK